MKVKGIGIIGHGVVGGGVVELLESRREALERAAGPYEVVGVAVRDATRPREGLPQRLLTTPEKLLDDPRLDVLVEVAGGVEEPFGWVAKALERKKAVVSANKAMLAERAQALRAVVDRHGGRIFCEAAVAGGIPIIQAIDRGLVANRILRVQGILNGTCNFLLTRMERERRSFQDALADAQRRGFAEADPTLDVSGGDAAHKLAVLAGLVLDRPIEAREVFTQGITALTAFDLAWAEENGFRIKLLASGRFGPEHIELRVHPTLVPRTRLISQVMEEFNAVEVEGDLSGPQLYYGRGAGRMPTASAVVADLVQALRGESPLRTRPALPAATVLPMAQVVSRHYLHFEVIDRPGVVAKVASALAERAISISSMYQPSVAHGAQVPLVLTTHPAPDQAVQQALAALEREAFCAGPAVHVRMEAE
jgi:homoserine dehydrogenase